MFSGGAFNGSGSGTVEDINRRKTAIRIDQKEHTSPAFARDGNWRCAIEVNQNLTCIIRGIRVSSPQSGSKPLAPRLRPTPELTKHVGTIAPICGQGGLDQLRRCQPCLCVFGRTIRKPFGRGRWALCRQSGAQRRGNGQIRRGAVHRVRWGLRRFRLCDCDRRFGVNV